MKDFQSNIVVYLMKKFSLNEIKSTVSLIVLSVTMNVLTVNIISRITASIL